MFRRRSDEIVEETTPAPDETTTPPPSTPAPTPQPNNTIVVPELPQGASINIGGLELPMWSVVVVGVSVVGKDSAKICDNSFSSFQLSSTSPFNALSDCVLLMHVHLVRSRAHHSATRQVWDLTLLSTAQG